MQLPSPLTHGVLISYADVGVMISGKSGIGKSDTALELIDLGAQLVCDDAPQFTLHSGQLIGHCQKQYQGIMHIRGLGLVHIPSLFGPNATMLSSAVDLIIYLYSPNMLADSGSSSMTPSLRAHEHPDIPMIEYEPVVVGDISIPMLRFIKAQERPMGLLLSTAIKQFKLRRENSDPCEKLLSEI